MQKAIAKKICTVCGLDVSSQSRVKDSSGRYHCESCWSAKSSHLARSSPQDFKQPDTSEDDGLIPFATNDVQQKASRSRQAFGSQEIGMETTEKPPQPHLSAREGPSNSSENSVRKIPIHLWTIAKWERRLLVVFLFSIIPPLGILLIPVQMFVTFKLARAMDKNGLLWACCTLVPYAGLLVLIILNIKATAELKKAGLYAPLFRSWRWRD
jgi:hypothetical protein